MSAGEEYHIGKYTILVGSTESADPYLDNPPALIPIDIGRQLFVDDFLIESTDLERSYHVAGKHELNPVMPPSENDGQERFQSTPMIAGSIFTIRNTTVSWMLPGALRRIITAQQRKNE